MDQGSRPRKTVLVVALFILCGLIAFPSPDFNETSRLAALGKVWGLLKYHHPRVAAGKMDWDAALIAEIPKAKSAQTREEFGRVLDSLIRTAGQTAFLYGPRVIPKNRPDEALFSWMTDPAFFPPPISLKLALFVDAFDGGSNVYVSPAGSVGNPDLSGEKPYDFPSFPDQEYRLLSLFRYWNIIQYFYPYKYLIDRDWEDVLEEFIPKMIAASTSLEYHLAVSELTACIHDTHAYASSADLANYWGYYRPPFDVSLVEGQSVVSLIYPPYLAEAGDLRVGDVITKIDGVPIDSLRQEKGRYLSASNEAAWHRRIHLNIFRGPDDSLTLTIRRSGVELDLLIRRIYMPDWSVPEASTPPYSILEDNIGYVDMGILKPVEVSECMTSLAGTQAIVFDVRNYPRGAIYSLPEYLYPEPRPFYAYSYADFSAPGRFLRQTGANFGRLPNNPSAYRGTIVILANELTISHAEFTCMGLQAVPGAVLIGSRTQGADGNVSTLELPGGITTLFTGIGIYYPDGRETQRVGIIPDIEVRPTIQGLIEGRDEVLERALAYIRNGEK